MLHNDHDFFEQLVTSVAENRGIDPRIIEKDYYVTVFLQALVKKQPTIVFKGGTSLSKCYKLINRFSEDIDLSLENNPTEGQRKSLKNNIVGIIDHFNFTLTNPSDIRSRRDFNRYIIDFPTSFDYEKLKQQLIVETSVFLRAYPTNTMKMSSLIYDYLVEENASDILSQYALNPFEIKVQDIRRTFIDKLFAIGDYYLDNNITQHSRHIYDIYKLYSSIDIDHNFIDLFNEVKKERSGHEKCFSAQNEVDLKALLQKIIVENVYKNDYENITSGLLFEEVPYDTAITALQKIMDSELFK